MKYCIKYIDPLQKVRYIQAPYYSHEYLFYPTTEYNQALKYNHKDGIIRLFLSRKYYYSSLKFKLEIVE